MSTILFRRDHLAMTKNFWCSCSRCCDSTEFGSNISTIFDRWLLLSLSFKKYPLSSNQASPFQPLSCVTDNIQSIAGNQCCQKIHWTHRLTGFARRQVRWKNFSTLKSCISQSQILYVVIKCYLWFQNRNAKEHNGGEDPAVQDWAGTGDNDEQGDIIEGFSVYF